MSTFQKIYSNAIGISFFWNQHTEVKDKVQLVFRDTGFLLTLAELQEFSSYCVQVLSTTGCEHCKHSDQCRNLLLRTPSSKIDLAVNKQELVDIQELINQTIMAVQLKKWFSSICPN
ncbi:DUF6686 family protein [Aquimarina brevivitae]|uniref:Uncharacterized protein n=1 Tax=Aquimarina brevivitae TaxID=323412 RepID=A0A4Q7PG60_9FLAO|nr:DUF6686 family protein [Aquimarina brevivitae]RZS99503.1 hypothetical protein EV197_0723 [Aquimarina brevivitae]